MVDLISLKSQICTRKEIQNGFIQYAIQNQLVDITTRCYNIFKNPTLFSKIRKEQIAPNELFHHLREAYLKPIE
jgi:hypothetical protein